MNILPRPERQPSTSDRFSEAFANLAQTAASEIPKQLLGQKQLKEENEALKKMGLDLNGIANPETRKILIQDFAKKKQEDTLQTENALDAINEMRGIIGRGRTGKGNPLNVLTSEGRADRAALDTAALTLEKLAATMVGKGVLSKPRFEYLLKRLPSAWKTDAENESILNEWERILSDKNKSKDMKSTETESEEVIETPDEIEEKVKFNISNPSHKKKRDQLMKDFKGDREKVAKALKREFY